MQLRNKEYKEGVTLITPTGDRQLAMGICMQYIASQDYQGSIQWVVADDGEIHLDLPLSLQHIPIVHIKRKSVRDKSKSITSNVQACLFEVIYDKILIIEDDDYYRPDYISTVLSRLQTSDLIGEGNSRYYNIACEKYRINHNLNHASLFQTALRSTCLEHLWISCLRKQSAFIDCRLWNKTSIKNKKIFVDKISSIGIKGLPGRPGIGSGHRPGKFSHSFHKDVDWKILKQWIGNNAAEIYINLRKEMECES